MIWPGDTRPSRMYHPNMQPRTSTMTPKTQFQLSVLFSREARDAVGRGNIGDAHRLTAISAELGSLALTRGFRGDAFASGPAPAPAPPTIPWKPPPPPTPPPPPKPGCPKC